MTHRGKRYSRSVINPFFAHKTFIQEILKVDSVFRQLATGKVDNYQQKFKDDVLGDLNNKGGIG